MPTKKYGKRKRNRKQTIQKRRRGYKYIARGGVHVRITPLEEFGLTLVNHINRQNVWRITDPITRMYTYIYIMPNINYLLVKTDDLTHVLKINEDAPELSEENLNEINQSINTLSIRKNINTKYNIARFAFPKIYKPPFDLSLAKQKILELNHIIRSKCGEALSLNIDYVYDTHAPNNYISAYNTLPPLNNIILCLYNDRGCISSITCVIDSNTLTICSGTDVPYREKKYNGMLRGAIIILAPLIDPTLVAVQSDAINPISAYLLIKYYNGIVPQHLEDNEDFYNYFGAKHGMVGEIDPDIVHNYVVLDPTKDFFTNFDSSIKGIVIRVHLTEPNIENANQQFGLAVDKIICS
jgi:hypothetical protein